MNNKNKKCSTSKHSDIDAINYCQECKIYLCNKCLGFHSELFEKHHLFCSDNNIKDIFTGFCEEKNHNHYELNFYCKTHNKLCCMACLCKFKEKGNGQHNDCDVTTIENIKDEKRKNLKNNLTNLKELFTKFDESFKKLKILFEEIDENKEKIKLKIQKIFTQIRNAINEREDSLLLEVDNHFRNLYFDEDVIRESQKLPGKIKISLEKGKILEEEWNDKNINSLINDCIIIENNINEIYKVNKIIEKYNSNSTIKIDFKPEKTEEINNFVKSINSFGYLDSNTFNLSNNSNIFLKDEIEFIISRLKQDENFKSKQINLNLLFTMSKDGIYSSNFHKKCDGIKQILVFIKTEKEEVFGGYTEVGFKSQGKKIKDEKAFIFSISKKKIYNILKDEFAIYDFSNRGPSFYGNCYFIINVDEEMINGNTCTKNESSYEGMTTDYEINIFVFFI